MYVFACSAIIAASVQVVCRVICPWASKKSKKKVTSTHSVPSSVINPNDPSELYAEGLKLEKAGDYAAAVSMYERILQIDPDNKEALYHLATIYKDGHDPDIERDVARAVTLSEKSIALYSDVRAMHNLGLILRYGPPPVTKDTKRAKQLWENALTQEPHARTMCSLAVLLEDGDGVPKDTVRAKKLYEEAIEKESYVTAMYNLAIMLKHGTENVPKDIDRTVSLYQRAIDEYDEVHAMYNLAALLWYGDGTAPKDQAKSIKLLTRAADVKGDDDSMVLLGKFLYSGGESIRKDIPRAKSLFERAINESNNVEAMYQRAAIARFEDKDDKKAVDLLNRAISEGQHVGAHELLGEMVLLGDDEPSRESRASQLFEEAIKGNQFVAMYNQGRLLETGADGVKKDPARAKILYERAANEDDHSGAMNRLGVMYRDGVEGVVMKDSKLAVDWFKKAVRDDANVDAMCNLADMLLEGAKGVQTNTTMAVALLGHAHTKMGFIPAMSKMAMLLWTGDDGVTKDVPQAIKLAQQAVDAEHRIFDIMLLSRMYMSPMAGDLQDVDRGQKLLDEAFRRRSAEPIVTPVH